jgi:hypothetical protein
MPDKVVYDSGPAMVVIRELRIRNNAGEWEAELSFESGTTLRCVGIRQLQLTDWPVPGGKLSGVVVYDVADRQMEGIRRIVADVEGEHIEISCQDVKTETH